MRFKEFVDAQNWRTATTAIRNPHAYIVRHKHNGTDEDFVYAVEFIWRNGFKITFWNQEYTVFYLEGHFYWVCGHGQENKLEDDKLILNRNNAEDYIVTFAPRGK